MENKEFYRWLIPQKGLLVRDPLTRAPLSEQGEWKPWIGPEGRAWRRKVRQRTVTIGQPPILAQDIKDEPSAPTAEIASRRTRRDRKDNET